METLTWPEAVSNIGISIAVAFALVGIFYSIIRD
jgi:hypothetical protein